jgi:hypothetical protein
MSNFVDFSAQQSPRNRWAAALNRLSQGLGEVAKMHEARDIEESKDKRMDAREAARQAFDMNLARFTQGSEDTRADKAQGAETAREHERTISASEDRRLQREQHDIDEKDRVRHERAVEGIDSARLGSEESRAKIADAKAEAAARRAAETADKDRAATALHSTEADLKASIDAKRDVEKQLADPMMKFDKTGVADKLRGQLDSLNTDIGGLQQDLRTLRHQAGYTSSLDKSSAGGAAKMAPDRQQLYDDLKAKNPDKDPAAILDQVQKMPQKQLDSVMKLRPTADTGSSGSPDASGAGSIAADSGPGHFMDEADATASTAAPQSGMPDSGNDPNDTLDAAEPQGADQQATAKDATQGAPQVAAAGGAPDAGTQPPADDGSDTTTTNDQIDQGDQYAQMSQQLNQSPQGQAVHATLDRLAQTDNSVQQEKFQRQAQIQLQDLYPDQDPDGYIGWYTQQQQQEPEYS